MDAWSLPILRTPTLTSPQAALPACHARPHRRYEEPGICYDNAVAESFFATYKKELIHTRPWPDLAALKKAKFSWIEEYYNRTRRHSTLEYLTPAEYELGLRDINQIAA